MAALASCRTISDSTSRPSCSRQHRTPHPYRVRLPQAEPHRGPAESQHGRSFFVETRPYSGFSSSFEEAAKPWFGGHPIGLIYERLTSSDWVTPSGRTAARNSEFESRRPETFRNIANDSEVYHVYISELVRESLDSSELTKHTIRCSPDSHRQVRRRRRAASL